MSHLRRLWIREAHNLIKWRGSRRRVRGVTTLAVSQVARLSMSLRRARHIPSDTCIVSVTFPYFSGRLRWKMCRLWAVGGMLHQLSASEHGMIRFVATLRFCQSLRSLTHLGDWQRCLVSLSNRMTASPDLAVCGQEELSQKPCRRGEPAATPPSHAAWMRRAGRGGAHRRYHREADKSKLSASLKLLIDFKIFERWRMKTEVCKGSCGLYFPFV